MKAIRNNIDRFLFQPAKVAPCLSGLSKAGPLRVSAKSSALRLRYFPESLAQSGTGLLGRQEIKIGSRVGECLTEKYGYEQNKSKQRHERKFGVKYRN